MSFSGVVLFMFLGLILFGPRKSMKIGKQIGRIFADLRRSASQLQSQLEQELRSQGSTIPQFPPVVSSQASLARPSSPSSY